MTGSVAAAVLSAEERAYLRRKLGVFFGTLPTVAEGSMFRTRRTGPEAGQPKLPPAACSLVDGLAQVVGGRPWPRLLLSEAGLATLGAKLESSRAGDRAALAHVRRELGVDAAPDCGEGW